MSFETIGIGLQGAFLCTNTCCIALSLYCTISVFVRKMPHYVAAGYLTLLAFEYFLNQPGYEIIRFMAGRTNALSEFESVFLDIPAGFLCVYLVFALFVNIFGAVKISAWTRNNLTSVSIKESMDALPMGILFSKENGQVLLANRVMEEICYELTQNYIKDGNVFFDMVLAKSKPANLAHIVSASNRTFSFEAELLKDDPKKHSRNNIWQLTAIDISEEYRLFEQLEKENSSREEMNKKLQAFGQIVEATTREKEILNTKVRVHDNLGQALLMAKRCLGKETDLKERENVLDLWRQNIFLLAGDGSVETELDGFGEVLSAAHMIGVRVRVSGVLPAIGSIKRKILEVAAHECLTNTVRHACGDELYIEIEEDKTSWKLRLYNNGKPPVGEVVEGGGLISLHKLCDQHNATMTIVSRPQFELIIEI